MKKLNKKQIHTLGYNYAIFVCGEREKLKSSLKDMFLIYRENYNLPKKYKTHIQFLDTYITIYNNDHKEDLMVTVNPFIKDTKEYFIFNKGVYDAMNFMLEENHKINEKFYNIELQVDFDHEYELYLRVSEYCNNNKKNRLLKKYSDGVDAMKKLVEIIQNEDNDKGYGYIFNDDFKIIEDRYKKGNSIFKI